jgi:hypothetical protein
MLASPRYRPAVLAAVVAAAWAAACSNDFTIPDAPPPRAGAPVNEAAATAGDASAGAPATADAATTGDGAATRRDGGARTAADGGAGKLANGEPCTARGRDSKECASGFCREQDGDGVRAGLFCTIECDHDDEPDPICTGAAFTGHCGPDGDCIVE